ncbi:MAG: hypothetical protein K8F59_06755 [Rhodobacteraceae bacterium]|nr:hypothetical protein [Paracoccaceae bacterium]
MSSGPFPAIAKALRLGLTLALLVSLAGTLWRLDGLRRDPAFAMLVDTTSTRIAARLDRMAAEGITQAAYDAKMQTLLDAEPRNWLAIEAVEEAASAEGLAQPPDIAARRAEAEALDHGWLATGGKCAACMWDPKACEFSAILWCRAPVDLTPVGDIAGVVRESGNYALGYEVDMFDLTLSAVGLGAEILIPLTFGTSASVKVGATLLRTGRHMGAVTPAMARFIARTGREAINWNILATTRLGRLSDDLPRAVDPSRLRPLMALAETTGDLRGTIGLRRSLHVLRFADDPAEAARLARAVEAGGPRTVGRLEFLGKSRVFRATLRYADEVVALGIAAFGLATALIVLVGNLVLSFLLRRLHRGVRARPVRGDLRHV